MPRIVAVAALLLLSLNVSSPPQTGISSASEVEPPSLDALNLSDEELARRVELDLASLGSLAIGTPGSGILLNPAALPAGPRWEIVSPDESWGTAETIASVKTAIDKVHELLPEAPPIFVGDISLRDGGRLKRHATHQVGRDVDLGFFYRGGKGVWYTPGTPANLDLARNWVLVRALLLFTDVETILLDRRIQKSLYDYALKLGEDKAWLDRIFEFSRGSKYALIRHVAGHRTHYHVRFYNPLAQELGRRAYPFLIQLKKIKPPVFTIPHVVQPGETLGHLADRYRSSVRAIQQANGLASTLVRAGRTYRVPIRGAAAPPVKPLILPARPLPPRTPATLAALDWPSPLVMYGEELTKLARTPCLLGGTFRLL